MNKLNLKLEGSPTIWIFYIVISVISLLVVFSASTLIVSMQGTSYIVFILKHIILIFLGFFTVYTVHKIDFIYFLAFSKIMMILSGLMLLYTFTISSNQDGETTSRWIRIPIINMTFQPSTLAIFSILLFTTRYLGKNKIKESFGYFFKNLILPVGIIIILILPSNFSTAFLCFFMFFLLLFIGGEKIKNLFILSFSGIIIVMMFIFLVKISPNIFPNRINTWQNRIDDFLEGGNKYDYQIEKSKAAISSGGIKGLGPGKSIQKHSLPQSNTDFIFAVIVEEYGVIGGIFIILLYLLFMFRVLVLIIRQEDKKRKLLLLSCSLPIVFSAFVNMGVAVNVIPITGQPLPFISSGGTSVLIYSIGIGIILNLSKGINIKSKA